MNPAGLAGPSHVWQQKRLPRSVNVPVGAPKDHPSRRNHRMPRSPPQWHASFPGTAATFAAIARLA